MSNKENNIAKVAHILDKFSVVINQGSDQDIEVGDTFLIYTIGAELRDPDTKKSLGKLEIVRGRAVVKHVQENISTLESSEFDNIPGRRRILKNESRIGILGLSTGLGNEEIEEAPTRKKRKLGAQVGDFAKLLSRG